MVREILLTQGRTALVDDCDYERVAQFKWHYTSSGYAATSLPFRDGRRGVLLMHRFIVEADDTVTVDHRDHVGTHNYRSNLRIATQSQQNANRRSFFGTSKYKGVYLRHDGKKWVAQIKHTGKTKRLGSFATEEQAALAYNEAAKHAFGEFAYLNQLNLE